MGDWLTASELADRLHLQPGTIRLWARGGIIPSIKLTGRVIRFDVADVESALRKRAGALEAPCPAR